MSDLGYLFMYVMGIFFTFNDLKPQRKTAGVVAQVWLSLIWPAWWVVYFIGGISYTVKRD